MLLFTIIQLVPWYLFPGSIPQKNAEPVEVKKDTVELTVTPVAVDSVVISAAIPAAETIPEPLPEAAAEPADTFRLDIPEVMEVTVLLPFRSSGKANGSSLDFYSGILMAARDLGCNGVKMNINAIDILDSNTPVTSERLASSDIIIGPIAEDDIRTVSGICPEDKWIISPLEPKAAALCDTLRIIHVPSRVENQYSDIAEWISEDYAAGDRVFIIRETSDSLAELPNVTVARLDSLGIKHRDIFSFKEFNSPNRTGLGYESAGTDRFVIASENEAFICESVRKVSVLAMSRYKVALYCPSKVRTFENASIEQFHNCSMRMSSTYSVDYSDPDVKKFIYSYRALFNCEPNSFAFHGYDTMKYFVSLCREYGRQWPKKIEGSRSDGLQIRFDFGRSGLSAYLNNATVRSVYNKDYSITLSK